MGPLSSDRRLIPCGEGAVRAIYSLFRIRVCSCGRAGATSRMRSRCAPVHRRNSNDRVFATVRGPAVRHQRVNSTTGGVQQYLCRCSTPTTASCRWRSSSQASHTHPAHVSCCVAQPLCCVSRTPYGTMAKLLRLPCVRLACLAARSLQSGPVGRQADRRASKRMLRCLSAHGAVQGCNSRPLQCRRQDQRGEEETDGRAA